MNNEKIIEIAIRYGCLELCNSRWVFSENGLHKFARVLIEEDRDSVEQQGNRSCRIDCEYAFAERIEQ